jgi:hypothetical protein
MSAVRSRLLLGASAWLLGATSATAGSLYAVNLLGNSLLSAPSRQMSVEMVRADLAQENAQRARPLPARHEPRRSRQSSHKARTHERPATSRTSPSQSASPAPTSSSAGVFLSSADGGAEAVCEAGGAYLLYWTPQTGFEADQVTRGPAAVASVVFREDSGGILMQVSCRGGVPVKKLTSVGSDDGGGHDE